MSDNRMTNPVARAALASVSFGLLLAGCTVQEPISPGLVQPAPIVALGQDEYAAELRDGYVIRPSDRLSVTVFREAELSLPDVLVSAEGRISVPLVGSLNVTGMTVEQVEQLLEARYDERYLRSPDVAVNVIEYASHTVTVEGSVERQGLYNFRPGTRLSGGIALASGTSRTADVREVAIFRRTEGGMLIAKFDYAQVRSGAMIDPVLHPGDRIVVGTDNLSQTWQDLLRALPAFGLFTQL